MKDSSVFYLARIFGLVFLAILLFVYAQEEPQIAIPIGIAILFILVIVAILRWVFLVEKRTSLLFEISEQLKELNKVSCDIKKSLSSIKERVSPDNINDIKPEGKPQIIQNIKVKCPHCTYFFNIPKEYLNRKVKCAKCKQEFIVNKQLIR